MAQYLMRESALQRIGSTAETSGLQVCEIVEVGTIATGKV
jgi:hypothetical protein